MSHDAQQMQRVRIFRILREDLPIDRFGFLQLPD
jgi:hypothetical protein